MGCSSDDNLIIRAFAISFQSAYLSCASGPPIDPAVATKGGRTCVSRKSTNVFSLVGSSGSRSKGLLWPDTCCHRIPFTVTPAALVSLVGEKGLGFSSLAACYVIPRALVWREERKSREEQEEIDLCHLLWNTKARLSLHFFSFLHLFL